MFTNGLGITLAVITLIKSLIFTARCNELAARETVVGHPEGPAVHLKMGCDFPSEPIPIC